MGCYNPHFVGCEGDLHASNNGADEAFSVTLQDVLLFSTGAAEVPPIGFHPTPALAFHDDGLFPRANTCSNTLSLSLEHSQYEEFKYYFLYGVNNTAGFGKV